MRPGVRSMELDDIRARLRPHLPALIPGAIAVALMLIWAVHDGGYDHDTWYWGALVFAGAARGRSSIARGPSAVRLSAAGARRARRVRPVRGLVVSVDHLGRRRRATRSSGSNRALLYLLVFATLLVLPWTPQAARCSRCSCSRSGSA